jgi:hypothetical protein
MEPVMAAIGPLDPDVLNESIPAFFIGRNAEGFWIARERSGASGGLFLLKNSAISFARAQAGEPGCATIFPTETFELDVENGGNRLVPHIIHALQRAIRLWRTIGRLVDTMRLGSRTPQAL